MLKNLEGRQRYTVKVCAATNSLANKPMWGDDSEEREVFLPEADCLVGDSSFAESDESAELSVGMIVGAVSACIFLGLACVGFVIWRYAKFLIV